MGAPGRGPAFSPDPHGQGYHQHPHPSQPPQHPQHSQPPQSPPYADPGFANQPGSAYPAYGAQPGYPQSNGYPPAFSQSEAFGAPQSAQPEHQRLRQQYEEFVLCKLLMRSRLVPEAQLRSFYQTFCQGDGAQRMAQNLVAQGLIDGSTIHAMVIDLNTKIHACLSCGHCYYLESASPGQSFPCKRCPAQVQVGGAPPAAPSPYASNALSGFPATPSYGAPQGYDPSYPGPAASNMGQAPQGYPAVESSGYPSGGGFGAGFPPPQQSPHSSFQSDPYGAAAAGYGQAPQSPPPLGLASQGPGSVFSSQQMFSPPANSNLVFGQSAPSAPVFGSQPGAAAPDLNSFSSAPLGQEFNPTIPLEDLQPGGDGCPETFGDYDIEQEIARGGMGVVYLARHRDTQEPCALKVMLESVSQNPKRLKRFQREIDAHRKLIHENIVRILDSGKVDDFYYFTMEYVDGKPLDDLLKEDLEIDIVMEILEKICRATNYAHSMRVVHRDLKPANVLVTAKMVPKLTDFGLAKSADHVSVLTKTGAVVGTPYYLSPEQAAGHSKDVDHRADVYALGVMMYEMITNRLPFTGKTSVELFRKIIHDEPIPPTKIKPQLTEQVERVCLKALEKNPADRYQSAGALADDIRCLIEGKPIEARRPSKVKQMVRRLRKKGMAPIAAGVGVVILLVFGGLIAWQLHSANVAEHQDKIASEWSAYQESLSSDRAKIEEALADAARFTRAERGAEALDAVNKAVVFRALMDFRGAFSEQGIEFLSSFGGDFDNLSKLLEGPQTNKITEELAKLGIAIDSWPEALKFDENRERAAKDHESPKTKELYETIKTRIFLARGYAKMTRPDKDALAAAREEFTNIASSNATSDLPQIALGDVELADANFDEALRKFDIAIDNNRASVDGYLGKARTLVFMEDFNRAFEVLRTADDAVADQRGKARILAARAEIAVKTRKFTKAKADVQAAYELAPDDFSVLLARARTFVGLGLHLEAEQAFDVSVEAGKSIGNPEALIARCEYYLNRRLYDEALQAVLEAKRVAVNSNRVQSVLAEVYERLLDTDKARRIADETEKICRTYKRQWRARSHALRVLARLHAISDGDTREALNKAKKACELWKNNADNLLLQGHLLLAESNRGKVPDRDKLARVREIANRIGGTRALDGQRLLGLAIAADREDIRRARSSLDSVNRENGNDPLVLTVLAEVSELSDDKNPKRIENWRRRALRGEQDVDLLEGDYLARSTALLFLKPYALPNDRKVTGRYTRTARRCLREALFLNPKNVHVLTRLGRRALETNTWTEAQQHLDKACALNPLFAPAFLARALLKTAPGNESGRDIDQAAGDLKHLRESLNVSDYEEILDYRRARLEIELLKNGKAGIDQLRAAKDQIDLCLEFEPTDFSLLKRKKQLLDSINLAINEQVTEPLKDLDLKEQKLNVSIKQQGSNPELDAQRKAIEDERAKLLEPREKIAAELGQLKSIVALQSERDKVFSEARRMLDDVAKGQGVNGREAAALVKRTPRVGEAWMALCYAELQKGDLADALAAMARAAVLSPRLGQSYPRVLDLAGRNAARLRLENFTADVVKALDKVEGAGKAQRIHKRLATALAALLIAENKATEPGALNAARRAVEEAAVEQPQLPLIHGLRARLLQRENKPEEALKALKIAYVLTDRGRDLTLELARAYHAVKDFDMVIRLLLRAKDQEVPFTQELSRYEDVKNAATQRWNDSGLP